MQLAAGQGGLEQVGGVHRPLGFAGADQGVHLVDEQDDRAFRGDHLVQHRLQPLLELAAVLRAGDQRAHVQRQELLVLQGLRHVAVDDAQGQALDDGGLADARFPDQHGIVLGAPRQHLDGAADLLVAADHRVELLVPGGLGQVAGVALQRVVAFLGRGAIGGAAFAYGLGGGVQPSGRHARLLQRFGGRAAFLGDGREQALGGDEGVAEGLGFLLGLGEHTGGLRLQKELAVAALHLGGLGQQGLGLERGGVRPPAGGLDQLTGQAVLLLEQHLEQVLGAKLLMLAAQGQRLRRLHGLFGAVRIEIDVHSHPQWANSGRPP